MCGVHVPGRKYGHGLTAERLRCVVDAPLLGQESLVGNTGKE